MPNNGNPGGDTGNTANYYDGDYTIGGPYRATEVGDFENSASPYGTFDQGGNLWEWNESAVTGSTRGLRGGFWASYSVDLPASYRYRHNPSYEYLGFGFRVASVSPIPEPGSITLLVCGLAVGLIWHWRRR